MRHMYPGEDRKEMVAKLTTRVPFELRNQLKVVASWPLFGYRTQTQMYSHCLVEFLRERPWEHGLKWRHSVRASVDFPLFHAHIEPTEMTGKQVLGGELKARALELAAKCGVNQSTFALTFFWWIVLHKHPLESPALMEPLMTVKGAVV